MNLKYRSNSVFQTNSLFVLHVILFCFNCLHAYAKDNDSHNREWYIHVPGDIYLGGLFPVHQSPYSVDGRCGKVKSGRGIQRLEAMMFALHVLNRRKDLLVNISNVLAKSKNQYGAIIYDTCDFDSFGVDAAIRFAMTKLKDKTCIVENNDSPFCSKKNGKFNYTDARNQKEIVAVIGGASSEVTVATSHIFRMAQIPQISYSSTSSELSNRIKFNYFSRTVPADDMQASVMAKIISTLKWTYIAIVKESGNYGERFAEDLKTAIKKTNVCIATDKTIPSADDEHRYIQVLEELDSEEDLRNVRVIVVFAQEDVVRKLLKYTTLMNLTNRWIWVSSDAWGYKKFPVSGYEKAALNAITIAPTKYRVQEFDNYFRQLDPYMYAVNPWFKEYWEEEYKCKISTRRRDYLSSNDQSPKDRNQEHTRTCSGKEHSAEPWLHSQESFVHFVIDAVFATAIAIENILTTICADGKYCSKFKHVKGKYLQDEIRNVSFTSMSGREVRFDSVGNGISSYDIFQYQYDRFSNDFQYKKIGSYQCQDRQHRLLLDYDNIVFWDKRSSMLSAGAKYGQHPDEIKGIPGWKLLSNAPPSYCQQECPPGVIRINARNKCCWTCKPCPLHHIAVNGTACVECTGELTTNHNQTECVQMEPQYLNLKDPLSILAMVLALIGLLSNSILLFVFIHFSNTPIIKASARELCYVLIFGMTACYGMTFFLVSKPCIVVCSANRFGVSVSLSICLSALLIKTNRISRIFNRSNKTTQKTSFVSPRSQLLICFLIISFQISTVTIWFAIKPTRVNKVIDYFHRDSKRLILTCDSDNNMIAVSLLYNMIMVACCTIYAFKTRKIPENFNEAKYIGFTMYSVCLIWLAFIAIYFGVASSEHWFRIQMTTIAICLTLSAYVITICLFVPKVFIVIFQPRKNIKQKPNIKQNIICSAIYDSMQIVQEDVIGTVLGLRQINCALSSPCSEAKSNPVAETTPTITVIATTANLQQCSCDIPNQDEDVIIKVKSQRLNVSLSSENVQKKAMASQSMQIDSKDKDRSSNDVDDCDSDNNKQPYLENVIDDISKEQIIPWKILDTRELVISEEEHSEQKESIV
ncbi:hypothetical protein GJ496_000897 [Pomphorhynchus laevis]|nr:hypothetical protein GJ496_000897 [Pomphorhynchus laevis]